MPGGIDQFGAYWLDPEGNRRPATLTDITVTLDGQPKVEAHDVDGLQLNYDSEHGIPNISSLLTASELFKGKPVCVTLDVQNRSFVNSHQNNFRNIFEKLIPWKRGKE